MGVPVSAGLASGAKLVATKPVVASWVLLVPAVAVGAVGAPVRAGLASGAYTLSSDDLGVSLTTAYQIADDEAYCSVTLVFWSDIVSVAGPPVLLNTSLPPVASVTEFAEESIFLIVIRDLSAGEVGSVTVNAPEVASTGIISPAAAV